MAGGGLDGREADASPKGAADDATTDADGQLFFRFRMRSPAFHHEGDREPHF